MERKIFYPTKVTSIEPIKGADFIESVCLGGWTVLTKKGLYSVGQEVVYFEIDSLIPSCLETDYLSPYCKTIVNDYGVKKYLIKTLKLKGVYSQGVIFPVTKDSLAGFYGTEIYSPQPTVQSKEIKGNFPAFIPKTNQERYQNLKTEPELSDYLFTEKLDGTSCTVFLAIDGELRLCSRNFELKPGENFYFRATVGSRDLILSLAHQLHVSPFDLALQGEIIGGKIQGKSHSLKAETFYLYNVWNIKEHFSYPWQTIISIIDASLLVPLATIDPTQAILKQADGLSSIDGKTIREGFVARSKNSQDSFKVISNNYLIKGK